MKALLFVREDTPEEYLFLSFISASFKTPAPLQYGHFVLANVLEGESLSSKTVLNIPSENGSKILTPAKNGSFTSK